MSYRWIDKIYHGMVYSILKYIFKINCLFKDHESAFINEMKKLNAETRQHYDLAFVQELIRCNVILKEYSNKLAEEKRQLRKKYFNIEKQVNIKDKNLIDKDLEIEKLKMEIKQLEANKNSRLLKCNNLSDSPLIMTKKNYDDASIIDDSLTKPNSPKEDNSKIKLNANETVNLLASNKKKRKNPFLRFDLNNDDSDSEFFDNKQIKLSDISKLCVNDNKKKNLNDNYENNRISEDVDVLVVKPIEHKHFSMKTKSASSLTDNSNKQNSVYSYCYDGLGGHKKFLNPVKTSTNPVNSLFRKNITKLKVSTNR